MKARDIVPQRMLTQRLTGKKFANPEDVVRFFGAVQSQDYANAKWAVGQRVENCNEAQVHEAFQKGRILRTHVMRPTWHFVAPEDIRWMHMLTSHRVKSIMSHYNRKLGLTEKKFKKANAILEKVLSGNNHLTRAEISSELKKKGINATGMNLGFIVSNAELDALICSGAMKGKQHTYALVEERAPQANYVSMDEALKELTKRYFTSHGPAQVKDCSWWSGLTQSSVRRGIEMNGQYVKEETIEGKTYYFSHAAHNDELRKPIAHLLPNYDEYFIAYNDRSALLDASLQGKPSKELYQLFYRHIICMNGKIVGGWKNPVTKKKIELRVQLLSKLNASEKEALHMEAERYGRFVGMPIAIRS